MVCDSCLHADDYAGPNMTMAVKAPPLRLPSYKDLGGLSALIDAYKTLRRRLPPEWPNVRIWGLASVIVRRTSNVRKGEGTPVLSLVNKTAGFQLPAMEDPMPLTELKVGDWVRVIQSNAPAIVRAVGGERCMVEYNDGTSDDFDMKDLREVFKH